VNWITILKRGRFAALLLFAVAASGEACPRGADLFQRRNWIEAAKAFEDCENANPGSTDALLYRGKALINVSDFAAAGAPLEAYVAAHPQSDDSLYLLGYVRFRQGHPRESLELFARAAKLKAPQAGDLKIAALDYALLDDYTSAARYLEQSLQLEPNDIEARYHLGRVRYQRQQFEAAIAAFTEVLKRDPNNVKAEENLGLCLEAKNRISDAITAYRKAIELDSASSVRFEQPYLDLGKLLTTLDRPAEAVPVLQQAISIQPKSASAHYELGRAQLALRHLDDARLQLEEAAELDPVNGSPHYLLGRIYKRLGKTEEAAKEFKRTEELVQQHNSQSGGMASGR
jgi:tetratricopeptide (TPR) repeat protein